MAEIMRFVVTSEYDGVKAGRYLRTFCKLSARTLSLLKRQEGAITADGKLLRTVDFLKEGSIVEIKLPEENNSIVPIEGELDILFEDSHLLIVNKSADMPVHPVKTHQTDTLANIIAYISSQRESEFVFRAVNRLDRDTTGIVIIAKDRHTASVMQNLKVKKLYYAVCHGTTDARGTINEPIALAEKSKIVRTVREDGQESITHYSKVEDLKDSSLVELLLETGRTHQIRCHMAHLSHPLYGDDLYGGSLEHIKRQALHCHRIEFVHPFTNEAIKIECPMPNDMLELIKILKI